MGLPRIVEARLFYRAAKQRYLDAELLLDGGRTTGAVYMGGYTVECLLKALILAGAAKGPRKMLLAEFRGSKAHDIEWLLNLHRRFLRTTIPRHIVPHVSRVASWSTDLRYATGAIGDVEAKDFLMSVAVISTWAEGRT